MKFDVIARFRDTISTVKSFSTFEIYKNYGFSSDITVLPFQGKLGKKKNFPGFHIMQSCLFKIYFQCKLKEFQNYEGASSKVTFTKIVQRCFLKRHFQCKLKIFKIIKKCLLKRNFHRNSAKCLFKRHFQCKFKIFKIMKASIRKIFSTK